MESITIENVYELAQELAPRIVRNLGFSGVGAFQAEDVASSYVVTVLEKGYIARFDKRKGTLKNYVYQGLKNMAISMMRKTKYEIEMFLDTGILDLLNKRDYCVQQDDDSVGEGMWLEELTNKAGAWRFGKKHKRGFTFDNHYYAPTQESVVSLAAQGFSRNDLAKRFRVSATTIGNIMGRVRDNGLTITDVTGG